MEIRSTITSVHYGVQPPTFVRATTDATEAGGSAATAETASATSDASSGPEEEGATVASPAGATADLSDDELSELQTLKSRDTEVRAHEQAHMAAGGRYITSGASYDYQTGPDGQKYAIGGEVGIDTSPVSGDPAASAAKARTLIRAALAPAEPSGQDLSVAASAKSMESAALQDLVKLQQEEQESALVGAADAGTEAGTANTGSRAGADAGSSSASTTSLSERLERRIAGLFASQAQHAISQFA